MGLVLLMIFRCQIHRKNFCSMLHGLIKILCSQTPPARVPCLSLNKSVEGNFCTLLHSRPKAGHSSAALSTQCHWSSCNLRPCIRIDVETHVNVNTSVTRCHGKSCKRRSVSKTRYQTRCQGHVSHPFREDIVSRKFFRHTLPRKKWQTKVSEQDRIPD